MKSERHGLLLRLGTFVQLPDRRRELSFTQGFEQHDVSADVGLDPRKVRFLAGRGGHDLKSRSGQELHVPDACRKIIFDDRDWGVNDAHGNVAMKAATASILHLSVAGFVDVKPCLASGRLHCKP
jgi:hypothetical protein